MKSGLIHKSATGITEFALRYDRKGEPMAKAWYRSKTIWVGLAQLAVGLTEFVTGALEAGEAFSWTLIVSGALHTLLRLVTKGPVTK